MRCFFWHFQNFSNLSFSLISFMVRFPMWLLSKDISYCGKDSCPYIVCSLQTFRAPYYSFLFLFSIQSRVSLKKHLIIHLNQIVLSTHVNWFTISENRSHRLWLCRKADSNVKSEIRQHQRSIQMHSVSPALGGPVSMPWFGARLLTGKSYDVLTLAPISVKMPSISDWLQVKPIKLTNSKMHFTVYDTKSDALYVIMK